MIKAPDVERELDGAAPENTVPAIEGWLRVPVLIVPEGSNAVRPIIIPDDETGGSNAEGSGAEGSNAEGSSAEGSTPEMPILIPEDEVVEIFDEDDESYEVLSTLRVDNYGISILRYYSYREE